MAIGAEGRHRVVHRRPSKVALRCITPPWLICRTYCCSHGSGPCCLACPGLPFFPCTAVCIGTPGVRVVDGYFPRSCADTPAGQACTGICRSGESTRIWLHILDQKKLPVAHKQAASELREDTGRVSERCTSKDPGEGRHSKACVLAARPAAESLSNRRSAALRPVVGNQLA